MNTQQETLESEIAEVLPRSQSYLAELLWLGTIWIWKQDCVQSPAVLFSVQLRTILYTS